MKLTPRILTTALTLLSAAGSTAAVAAQQAIPFRCRAELARGNGDSYPSTVEGYVTIRPRYSTVSGGEVSVRVGPEYAVDFTSPRGTAYAHDRLDLKASRIRQRFVLRYLGPGHPENILTLDDKSSGEWIRVSSKFVDCTFL